MNPQYRNSGKDCITTAVQNRKIVTKYNVILSLKSLTASIKIINIHAI